MEVSADASTLGQNFGEILKTIVSRLFNDCDTLILNRHFQHFLGE